MKNWLLSILFACALLFTATTLANSGDSSETINPCSPDGCTEPGSPKNVDPD